jgi:hypothetical protein
MRDASLRPTLAEQSDAAQWAWTQASGCNKTDPSTYSTRQPQQLARNLVAAEETLRPHEYGETGRMR